jgi:hypothetical protein
MQYFHHNLLLELRFSIEMDDSIYPLDILHQVNQMVLSNLSYLRVKNDLAEEDLSEIFKLPRLNTLHANIIDTSYSCFTRLLHETSSSIKNFRVKQFTFDTRTKDH